METFDEAIVTAKAATLPTFDETEVTERAVRAIWGKAHPLIATRTRGTRSFVRKFEACAIFGAFTAIRVPAATIYDALGHSSLRTTDQRRQTRRAAASRVLQRSRAPTTRSAGATHVKNPTSVCRRKEMARKCLPE
jgi:hypothetical protein